MRTLLFVALFGVYLIETVTGDCEVCVNFLKKFESKLTDEDRKDNNVLVEKLKKACGKAKNKDQKFCYYVGGTADAATYSLNEITKRMKNFFPVEKICKELNKKDSEICNLRPDKEIDWKTVNLKKLRVKDLRKILSDWDETCKGCLEKSDYIKKIEEVKNRHVEL